MTVDLSEAPVPTVVSPALERHAARRRMVELALLVQTDDDTAMGAVAELITTAEAQGWPDVVRLGLYCQASRGQYLDGEPTVRAVTALHDLAERDGDVASLALALALRSRLAPERSGRTTVEADRDLARATVLAEGCRGPSTEGLLAHLQCALAYERRDLWELALRHGEAAEACLDWAEQGAERLPSLRFNRVEHEFQWIAALRESGHADDLGERADHARAALRATDIPSMPALWREELAVIGELIDAVSPPPGGARRSSREARGAYAGHVHLTRALGEPDPERALVHCEAAIEASRAGSDERIHLFALAIAVELESAGATEETPGQRWGRALVARRWERRVAALASMESLVGLERRASEHAELRRHAYRDDLTGLANRRALGRFLDELDQRGVDTGAVALVDLDRFKQINDTHGHAAGDAALVRIAELLRAGVGEAGFVARLGGDEFLVLVPSAELPTLARRCTEVLAALRATAWDGVAEGMAVGASFGVDAGPLSGFTNLCARADGALYRSKQAGGGQVTVAAA